MAALLLGGCSSHPPGQSSTTAALNGLLARQAVAADAAQGASRAIGKHLDGLGNDLSKIDGKSGVILEWLKGQP